MSRTIGIDIGSFSVKVASLSKKGKGYNLEAVGIALNPYGARYGADETSQMRVAETVKKLLSDVKISASKAAFALAESQVYTKVVEMPILSDSELASAIHWEAEQYIPVPIDQVNIDYEVISRPKKDSTDEKMRIFLVAAPKVVVTRTTEFAAKCRLEISSLETEMLSVSRAMIVEESNPATTMIIHMGAGNTDLAVVHEGMLVMTHALESGGTALTRTLSTELGLEFSQAEEYKRSYGMDASQLEGKVRDSLRPMVDRVLAEAKKAAQYYNSNNPDKGLKRIILSGGSALLPGLVSYTAEYMGMEVVLGNAFSQVSPSQSVAIPNDTVSFSVAVGLAMREL